MRWCTSSLVLLLTACSTVTTPVNRSVLLSDAPPPRPNCRILFQPSVLPSLSQLADSAALSSAVAQYAQQHPLREGSLRALYSVGFNAAGRVERLKALDYWLPQGQEQAFAALVRPHLRQQPGGPTNLRLRVQPGSTPMLQVGRSEMCPPESRTQFRLTAPATAQLQRPQPVKARIHVNAQGQAQSIQVLSGSGDRELDRWVTEVLQRHAFSPGLIDGTPVAMDYEETVQISARP